jgi:hypothetical protein
MSDCLSYDFFSIAPLHVCRCQVCARLPPSLILRSPPSPYKSGFSNILLSCFCANSACLSGYSNEFLIWQMSLECINGVPSLIQRVPLSAPFLAQTVWQSPKLSAYRYWNGKSIIRLFQDYVIFTISLTSCRCLKWILLS